MVLRSGIIIPFQFRDNKKLLMIGIPEENRDLSIWDLKNVVRAAFGIYNFEFRNKKIGFNIPDELLLNYLAQRHDLTNFVIEVGQAKEEFDGQNVKLKILNTLSCSLENNVSKSKSHKKCDEVAPLNHKKSPEATTNDILAFQSSLNHKAPSPLSPKSPPAALYQKLRRTDVCNEEIVPETITQPIDPMDIIPKTENEEIELDLRSVKKQDHFFQNFGHNMLGHTAHHMTSQHYTAGNYNRFRRRGERMSKDQKELYVKYFEENPCMLTQRRNDIILEPHWHKLCNMLNTVPQGAMKNIEEWKQTFDAWRYRVFMYTRYNFKLTGAAVQNSKSYKPLTSTDQRAYAMWTSHKVTTPQDFGMDMFVHIDESNANFDC